MLRGVPSERVAVRLWADCSNFSVTRPRGIFLTRKHALATGSVRLGARAMIEARSDTARVKGAMVEARAVRGLD